MSDIIKFDKDKKLRACIQSTAGYPGIDLLLRKLPGADLRYAGLTPAQYGCFALLLMCVFIWMRSTNSAARGC